MLNAHCSHQIWSASNIWIHSSIIPISFPPSKFRREFHVLSPETLHKIYFQIFHLSSWEYFCHWKNTIDKTMILYYKIKWRKLNSLTHSMYFSVLNEISNFPRHLLNPDSGRSLLLDSLSSKYSIILLRIASFSVIRSYSFKSGKFTVVSIVFSSTFSFYCFDYSVSISQVFQQISKYYVYKSNNNVFINYELLQFSKNNKVLYHLKWIE